MVKIIFESHGTSHDNEDGLSSGWYDVELSPLGKKQAKELGERHKDKHYDAIFCSDLKRSWDTGEIAFKDRGFKIIKDKRLRECDYGDLERHGEKEVKPVRVKYIDKPFPNGQSYKEASELMKSFLQDLLKNYNDKTVMIVGSRATQYGLEHWIEGVALKKAVTDPWAWQPGWTYYLEELK